MKLEGFEDRTLAQLAQGPWGTYAGSLESLGIQGTPCRFFSHFQTLTLAYDFKQLSHAKVTVESSGYSKTMQDLFSLPYSFTVP